VHSYRWGIWDCPHAGVKDILKNLSEKQGKKMNSPESAKDIPKFLDLFTVWTVILLQHVFKWRVGRYVFVKDTSKCVILDV
jgi:hypothetical protein